MIDGISFVQKELLLPIISSGVLLFAAFIFKEWQTRNKGRFTLNAIVAFITLFALILIILEPSKEVEVQHKQGLLLTEGYRAEQQDSLGAIYEGIQVLEYNHKQSVRRALDSLTSLVVIGDGVAPYDFYKFDSIPTSYLANEITPGITKVKFNDHLVLGDEFRLSGTYAKSKSGSILVLQDSRGNCLDSILLKDKSSQNFSLKTVPKVSGDFIFQLSQKDSVGKVLASNPLPITIRVKEPIRVLIVNTFPTFETKYLKNFLADQGYEVTIRTQLTKGKYKFEYFNTKASPIYQFTEENLSKFNVVITDTETYFNFGKTVKNRFEHSIRENGLGFFIQPTELLFKLGKAMPYFSFKSDGVNELQLPNSTVNIEKYPFTFNETFAVNAIDSNELGKLSYYKQLGLGRVATTTLLNSYQLLLQGKDQVYKSIWTQILDKIVQRKEQAVAWQSQTELPKVGEPFSFVLRTGLEDFQVINTEEKRIPLLQDGNVSFKYSGTTYPKKAGWNTLEVEGDSTTQFSYYVYDADDWKSLSASNTRAANTKKFGKEIKENRTVMVNRPISLLLLYILFLLGIGWLWLSPKLSSQS
ncbi:MAG TPA: hypothetical protein DCG42_03145 [Maribacter sp.]|uniref:hypothetical protein n=1 Tax=unclassified Maribacter TaxID=2615042 RepID=UPI000EC9DE0F|nr:MULTISPECIES: hypothetical protein [unclassified Maribacter]HAF76293.1 hypothetical protein [Maribacter sp.]|tara:strand:- start:32139 stop:33893 length:1755 start_codon:yes stop_codon:yes gene_type:complete